ncbi:MAG: PAS domain S-box protein [Bacteroidota bacterium]|nr:PAS domain S-box protein [Bacteroidota bacterium]
MIKDLTKTKILAVEDSQVDFFLVKKYLENYVNSSNLINAKTFKEAEELLAIHNSEIEVILLDLSLPDKQREDLIAGILSISENIPVIVITGSVEASFAIHSLSMGVSDYLLKEELNATTLYKSILYNIERNNFILDLKISEQKYSDLFHLSPQPMWVYDLETLHFLDVNQAAITHYGYSYNEFIQMTIRDIRPEEELAILEAVIEEIKKTGQNYQQKVFKHVKKNGELIYSEIIGNIIEFNGKKAEIILANDITIRMEHMKAIEAQNKKFKEIAWIQSHVVRAPLARIMGIVDLILDENTTPEEKLGFIPHIQNSALELDQIIKDIVTKTKNIS